MKKEVTDRKRKELMERLRLHDLSYLLKHVMDGTKRTRYKKGEVFKPVPGYRKDGQPLYVASNMGRIAYYTGKYYRIKSMRINALGRTTITTNTKESRCTRSVSKMILMAFNELPEGYTWEELDAHHWIIDNDDLKPEYRNRVEWFWKSR